MSGVGYTTNGTSLTRAKRFRLPTGGISSTIPRNAGLSNQAMLGTGVQYFFLLELEAGDTITTATYISATQAAVTPTNQWAGIYSSAREKLAISDDKLTDAWAANEEQAFTFATPYVVPTSGDYYLTLMVAAGTVPSLLGVGASGASVAYRQAPILIGRDATNTGLTTPASAPATAAALTTTTSSIPYAWVS